MEQENQGMPGGWSLFGELSDAEQNIFNEAMVRIVGVKYEALQVSKQVTASMKYRYYCNASIPGPNANAGQAIVEILNTYDPAPVVINIARLHP